MPVKPSKGSRAALTSSSPKHVSKAPEFVSETQFNAALRDVLRGQGLKVLHLRECDQDGPSDLIVWRGIMVLAWAELKMNNEPLRPSQKEFLREVGPAGNAYVIRCFGSVQVLVLRNDDPLWSSLKNVQWVPDFRTFDWSQGFREWMQASTS